jgi:hypothetical protein
VLSFVTKQDKKKNTQFSRIGVVEIEDWTLFERVVPMEIELI